MAGSGPYGALILAIVGRIKRHVVLTDEQAVAVALWVLLAWVHETAVVHSPILLATSAEANGQDDAYLCRRLPGAAGADVCRIFRGGALPCS